ncbi:hypothetical protein [Halocatena salina]|uniref:Uncharacterized protein n=1 Tax=Halocatena salina TaxID=2934340 RepID=A0A8U0A601_9EURY|nr:hypothetical protein [Halocatena salina]UPM43347.1 hypothetical protein MW046_02600 [Halocatena salina]
MGTYTGFAYAHNYFDFLDEGTVHSRHHDGDRPVSKTHCVSMIHRKVRTDTTSDTEQDDL